MEAPAGGDHSSSAVFGNDRGAGISLAALKLVAGVDFCLQFSAFEKHRGLGRGRSAEFRPGADPSTSLRAGFCVRPYVV